MNNDDTDELLKANAVAGHLAKALDLDGGNYEALISALCAKARHDGKDIAVLFRDTDTNLPCLIIPDDEPLSHAESMAHSLFAASFRAKLPARDAPHGE